MSGSYPAVSAKTRQIHGESGRFTAKPADFTVPPGDFTMLPACFISPPGDSTVTPAGFIQTPADFTVTPDGFISTRAKFTLTPAGYTEAQVGALDCCYGAAVGEASLKRAGQIDGARLREARMQRALTHEGLAQKSGISERAIRDIEAGRAVARAETVQCLAKTLGVAPELLLTPTPTPAATPTPTSAAAPAPTRASPLPPPKLPTPTRLDALADLERSLGATPPPLKIGTERIAALSAARMQDIFATHAAYDGHRFALCGRIDQQRALSVVEARALKARFGVGARFHVVTEVAPGEPLGVTVHATTAALSSVLQAKMKHDVRLVVRVCVVGGKDDARVVSLFASVRKRAWGFVVEDVAE